MGENITNYSRRLFFIFIFALLINLCKTVDPVTHPMFTLSNWLGMTRLGSYSVSPDGQYAVYSLSNWRGGDDEDTSTVSWLQYKSLSTPTEQPKNITNTGDYSKSYSSPQFSSKFPNFVFFTGKGGNNKTQIFYTHFPPNEGELPSQLTTYPISLANLKIKGNSFIFSFEVYLKCKTDASQLQCIADEDKKKSEEGWDEYDKMMVRHWDKWDNGKINHIFQQKFILSASNLPDLNGITPVDLMPEMNCNSPVGPDGGSEMFDISNDESQIAFTCHERDEVESYSTSWKIYTQDISTPPTKRALSLNNERRGRMQNPRFNADGTVVSYLAMARAGIESDTLNIEVFNIFEGFNKARPLYGETHFNRSISDHFWYDQHTIFFIATDTSNNLTTNKFFKYDLRTENVILLHENDLFSYSMPVSVPNPNVSGRFLIKRAAYHVPADLYTVVIPSDTAKIPNYDQVTFTNSWIKEQKFDFTVPDGFSFPGAADDDELVQGFIFKPLNYVEGEKYPLAFLIHGGPESAWTSGFGFGWNPQMWVQQGYAVVLINPHGSTGKGVQFTDAVRNDWGGVPYQDLMLGLDYVKENFKWADTTNACAAGASYGGYMVNWIQGQTDKFKCLVTHDGVFSTLTMFYATEEIWFPLAEYCPHDKVGCRPWDKVYRNGYMKHSPEEFVNNWKTPHLVFHGSNDFRIPIAEGISLFTALQVKDVTSRFVHFVNENHWVLKNENNIVWYTETIGWMDKYLKTPKP